MTKKYKSYDLTGKRFGRLYVERRAFIGPSKSGDARWYCKCDCGDYHIVTGSNLRLGKVKSCGCLRRETSRDLIRPIIERQQAAMELRMIEEDKE